MVQILKLPNQKKTSWRHGTRNGWKYFTL